MATTTSTNEWLSRRTYAAFWVIGGLGLGLLTYLDQPVAGVAFYGLTILAAVVFKRGYHGPLFDERDDALERLASEYTLTLLGWASAVVFPALIILVGFGYYQWRPWLVAVASVVAAIFLTYATVLMVLVRRY